MPKFVVRDTQPCWVTWVYTVEAKSESDALERYMEGTHGEPSFAPEIGDSIDGITSTNELDVEQVED